MLVNDVGISHKATGGHDQDAAREEKKQMKIFFSGCWSVFSPSLFDPIGWVSFTYCPSTALRVWKSHAKTPLQEACSSPGIVAL